ncbi:hypothetical protein FQN60_009293 [Etheostoma spectabile]|uniref:Uncharacterized protein n=1 Tax=Etheostoma spectabile TaxID=54343 RepID=A0A5J5DIK2_9PERO|nr:hypothetical protein FQN60_009293 [Etheostoma spectabile]
MSSPKKKKNIPDSLTLLPPNPPQVHRKRPWMDTKPSFSVYPPLKQKSQGTVLAVKRDGLNEGADRRPSHSYGRGQNLLQSRKAVHISGAAKRCSSSRTELIKKRKNLRETLQEEEDGSAPLCGSSKFKAKNDYEMRYNYYIQKGIDLENVAPLMDSWLENIQGMVPCHLKSLSKPMELLVDEIKEDYMLSVKTAILKYTFKDLDENDEDKAKDLLPHRLEVKSVPKTWNTSFVHAQKKMRDNLHSINPTNLNVLYIWHVFYKNLRLIDVEEFHHREESMEISVFQQIVTRHVGNAREILLKTWFPEVHNIYYQGSKYDLLPASRNKAKLLSFFNCAAALMTSQLQNLAIDSIKDYTRLISQDPSQRAYEHPGFVLHLILEDREIKFEPKLKLYEEALLNVYELMIRSISMPGSQFGSTLKPIILPEILEAQQAEVRRVFWAECVRPKEYIHEFDKYATLVSRQAEEDVDQFLSEQHCFQDIMVEVVHYQQLAHQIQYTSNKVCVLPLFCECCP